jgi:hypothetical protein
MQGHGAGNGGVFLRLGGHLSEYNSRFVIFRHLCAFFEQQRLFEIVILSQGSFRLLWNGPFFRWRQFRTHAKHPFRRRRSLLGR